MLASEEGIFARKIDCLVKIPVHPAQLSDVSAALYAHLNSLISMYIRKLKGVVLCYTDSVGMASALGAILPADPRVYFELQAEFVVLSFRVGGKARGVVQEAGEGGGRVLSHGVINVAVAGIEGKRAGDPCEYVIRRIQKSPFTLHAELCS